MSLAVVSIEDILSKLFEAPRFDVPYTESVSRRLNKRPITRKTDCREPGRRARTRELRLFSDFLFQQEKRRPLVFVKLSWHKTVEVPNLVLKFMNELSSGLDKISEQEWNHTGIHDVGKTILEETKTNSDEKIS